MAEQGDNAKNMKDPIFILKEEAEKENAGNGTHLLKPQSPSLMAHLLPKDQTS